MIILQAYSTVYETSTADAATTINARTNIQFPTRTPRRRTLSL